MSGGGEEEKQRNSRMTNEENIPWDEIRVKGVSSRTKEGAQVLYPPRGRHCLLRAEYESPRIHLQNVHNL